MNQLFKVTQSFVEGERHIEVLRTLVETDFTFTPIEMSRFITGLIASSLFFAITFRCLPFACAPLTSASMAILRTSATGSAEAASMFTVSLPTDAFSSCGEPDFITTPWLIIPISSAYKSASSM